MQGTKPQFLYRSSNEGIGLEFMALNLPGFTGPLRIKRKLWFLAPQNTHALDTRPPHNLIKVPERLPEPWQSIRGPWHSWKLHHASLRPQLWKTVGIHRWNPSQALDPFSEPLQRKEKSVLPMTALKRTFL